MSERGDMTVTRIHTDRESHVEPPLNPDWDEFTQLRWQAAVVAYDTGLSITVREGGQAVKVGDEYVPVPGTYSLNVGRGSHSAFDFRSAWTFLNGVATGATAEGPQ